ncbi:MAG TPA: hypothetical protein VJZ32_13375 [Candidatus Bathyarchaeia archaeon]|nr:hypothetical protein [Candidatus Bathyarchaeia archaeon]
MIFSWTMTLSSIYGNLNQKFTCLFDYTWTKRFIPSNPMKLWILMTTGFDEFNNKIHDLVERENECDDLFEDIKNGNGENALRYFALRDTCKELRKEILKSAMSAGLTRENVNMKIKEAKGVTMTSAHKQK